MDGAPREVGGWILTFPPMRDEAAHEWGTALHESATDVQPRALVAFPHYGGLLSSHIKF